MRIHLNVVAYQDAARDSRRQLDTKVAEFKRVFSGAYLPDEISAAYTTPSAAGSAGDAKSAFAMSGSIKLPPSWNTRLQ